MRPNTPKRRLSPSPKNALNLTRCSKAIAATDAAQTRQKRIEPPAALLRTEADFALGLFVSKGAIGKIYEQEDIALIRALVRREGRRPGDRHSYSVFARGLAIIEHWHEWQEEVAEAEAASGYRAADEAQSEVHDRQREAAKKLAVLPANTFDGMVAKARAFQFIFPDDPALYKQLCNDLDRFGADGEALAMSLAADLIRLARKEA
jgi:hypothetical protein